MGNSSSFLCRLQDWTYQEVRYRPFAEGCKMVVACDMKYNAPYLLRCKKKLLHNASEHTFCTPIRQKWRKHLFLCRFTFFKNEYCLPIYFLPSSRFPREHAGKFVSVRRDAVLSHSNSYSEHFSFGTRFLGKNAELCVQYFFSARPLSSLRRSVY